ncbi:mercury(II) reductase [Candidatus Marsarchaeota archaeon]|nr:mercury(II) reductase [Candidatus Marsarchaeota archaeon]
MEEFEYVILGQGAAAFAAAIKANSIGIKTAMIGRGATKGAVLGGTCINVGCVPSKRLITVSTFIEELRKRRYAGLDYTIGKLDYAKIIKEKNKIVDDLRDEKYRNVLEGMENVTFIDETGTFIDANTVMAGTKEIKSKHILIATGARAMIPQIKGIEKVSYLTNEEALSIDKLPESLIVVGGRALGLEFAQLFAGLGVRVTLLQRSERIIPNWEPEVSSHLAKYLKGSGVDIVTDATLVEIDSRNGLKSITAKVKETEAVFDAEEILFATGRTANVEKLNLNAAGIQLNERHFIKVDKTLKTTAGSIYAAGDVTGEPMLETLAAKEGNTATSNIFENANKIINMNEVPSAIFTYPEAAMVGMTEEQVIKGRIKCNCSPLEFKFVAKAAIIGDARGLAKIVIDNKTKKILGVHILAPHAADLIHEGVLAVKFGLTIDDIIDTVHVFPTLSEGLKLAALAFYEDVSKLSCCAV